MAYFLGRDVVVAITTEDANLGVALEAGTDALEVVECTSGSAYAADNVATDDDVFAGARAALDGSSSVFNTQDTGVAANYSNEVSDLTGCDVRAMAREVIGTCQSMRVCVDGMRPKKVIQAMDEGEYDGKFN